VSRAETLAVSAPEPRPWQRAFCWLAFLGPFFYLTYGLANFITAQRHNVGSIVFAWERRIPFLDWTIIPYWSINAFYGLSLFVCATRAELGAHGRRLLTAQIVAVVCFILFPLEFTFQQPETHGLPGFLFAALTSFDRPFNQAPSLHIALLVILWRLYARHLPRLAHWPLHIWFALVGASVLTTYQHHFFDIPTGALLGVVCMWLWPEQGPSPLTTAALARDRRRHVLAARYLIGGGLIAALALWIGGAGLWLLWPAGSLVLVAANYAVLGPEGFQKNADGHMSLASRLLLAPYLAGAFVNSRSWTRRDPRPVAIGDGVWLGRIPLAREAAGFATVVDLCAELPGAGAATAGAWMCIPMLDLVPPQPAQLRDAAASIERRRSTGPVLVCCAVGYSRSAATVATWLITSHTAKTMSEAIERIRRARPRIVIGPALGAVIVAATEQGA
jgi:protein-tyrosine phosphatase/membrane-associated phospholipid phosphatase